MKKPTIGVLDIGASGGRTFVAVRDNNTLRLIEIHRFEHKIQYYWQKDSLSGKVVKRVCWSLGHIIAGMLDGLREVAISDEFELKSFGIDTWGSDGVLMNSNGDVLGLVPAGRDNRFEQSRNQILNQMSEKELFNLTGVQSYPFNVLNQVYWYCRNQPKLVDIASNYMPINSLLYYFLTGQRVAEYTWMSTTQLCSLGKAQYNRKVFSFFDLCLEKMPPIVMPGTNLGKSLEQVAADVGLKPFEVIAVPTHDTACAYAAAPVLENKNVMILSSGTWFMPGVLLAKPLVSNAAFEAGYSNEAGLEKIRFLKSLMGSWPLQELRRNWRTEDGKETPYSELAAMAREAKPLQHLIDIDDGSFFSPASMEYAIRAYCGDTGQRVPESRSQLLRACYEGLAIKVAIAAKQLKDLTGNRFDQIIIVGGGSRDPLLCQWIANASEVPVRTGLAESTAAGNALAQAATLGWVESIDEGRKMLNAGNNESVYMPDAKYAWGDAINKLKTINLGGTL